MKILVVISYQLGDILFGGSILNNLSSHDVTVLCETQGEVLLRNYDVRIQAYKRNGTVAVWDKSIIDKLDKHYDLMFLTVPSNNNEGLKLLASIDVDSVVYFPKLNEFQIRKGFNTIDVNQSLLKQLSSSSLNTKTFFGAVVDGKKINNFDYPFKIPFYPLQKKAGLRKKIIAVHCGIKDHYWRRKAFPIKTYDMICRELRKRGFSLRFIGDKRKFPQILPICRKDENFIGLSLDSTIDVLGECCGFVGDDCGPAHLAASMFIPTLTLWGPTCYNSTGPWRYPLNRHFHVEGTAECSPCYFDRKFIECESPICHDIDEGKILSELDKLIEAALKMVDKYEDRACSACNSENIRRELHFELVKDTSPFIKVRCQDCGKRKNIRTWWLKECQDRLKS